MDVPTKVITIVIYDFININIFFLSNYLHLNMNIESMDVFNYLYIVEYIF